MLMNQPASLRLNEVDARNHAVFKELARVRQYFDKIKAVENPVGKPEQRINKEAAARFIKADLSDQKDVGAKLNELIAKERAALQAKEAELKAKKKRKADRPVVANDSDVASGDSKKKQRNPKDRSSTST
jgi:exosome complex protein LRP1